MKIWNKGLYTYVEDDRLPVIKRLTEATVILKDIQSSILYIGPDNILFIICMDSVIYSMELTECISGQELIIDGNLTFAKDVIENDGRDPSIKTKTIKVSSYGLADNQAIICTDIKTAIDIRAKIKMYHYDLKSYNKIASETNLNNNDPEFMQLLELKADQGVGFYKCNTCSIPYMFPVFTGFPSVTKADNVDLNVYNIDPTHNIIELIVYKKKINKYLHIIYRTLIIV